MIEAKYGSRTDVGRLRKLNEDGVIARPPMFVVADGMGGHAAGEVASALALEQMATLAGSLTVQPDDVLAAISAANAAILDRARAEVETSGMGTTITGICQGTILESAHWFVFNVGDSRTYRFADDELVLITTDHSEVFELVAAGEITAAEARTHPLRNVVTRSLGTDPAPTPDIWVLPVREGERFLICSDGLPLELEEAKIGDVMRQMLGAQETADLLVTLAVEAGGRDNVSVVVVDVPNPQSIREAEITTAPRSRILGTE